MSTERTPQNIGGAPKPVRRPRRRKKIEFVEHLTGPEQMLLAFPWSSGLSTTERAEFADALAHHPATFSNAQLEALIISWKRRAQRAA
ncbi:MAG: hypothetical protein FWD85_05800 [Microbacteriaceae bacterium]|nr:hypothetical protein [Microbacteriaceae bacterium]MCL2794804.1 hypothetical protein [Microbacteriaceae bacterium]